MMVWMEGSYKIYKTTFKTMQDEVFDFFLTEDKIKAIINSNNNILQMMEDIDPNLSLTDLLNDHNSDNFRVIKA